MPQITDYTTLANVKELLQDLGSDYDALLPKIITRTSRGIDTYCRRSFGSSGAGVVRLFDGPSGVWPTTLFVRDIVSVSQIRVKVNGTGDPTWYTVPAGDYFLQPEDRDAQWPAQWIEFSDNPTGQIGCWPSGFRVIEVTGEHGWSAFPLDVEDACLQLVVRSWKARGAGFSDAFGVEGMADAVVTRAMPSWGKALLDRYRMPRIGAI